MIGRDYNLVGTEEGIRSKIYEALGRGPIKIKFVSRDVIGIIDNKKTATFESLSRGLVTRVLSDPLNRLADIVDDSGINVEEETLSDRNVNMIIQDVSHFSKKSVAICGKSNTVECLETTDWDFEKPILRDGGARETGQSTFFPTSIDSFDIGSDSFVCLVQSAANRVQIITNTGAVFASLGGVPGILPGEFRTPTSLSCYCEPSMSR